MIEFMLEINGMIDNNKPSSEHHERERERERERESRSATNI